jgi:hypothetical protein
MKPTPKAAAVLSRYTAWHRCIDLCAIGLFGILSFWSLVRVAARLILRR